MARHTCYVCNAEPGEPCQAIDGEIAECPRPSMPMLLAVRFCDGGERVSHGIAASACDYCSGGICRQMQACEMPV